MASLEQTGAGREKVALRAVIEALGARGFGPLLVVLSLLVISPVGMVPGVPAIVGATLFLIGLHMMIGRTRLWLPARLGRVMIGANLLRGAAKYLRKVMGWLHPVLGQRRSGLSASPLAVALIGITCVASGVIIIFAGFIPGLPFALSWHLLVFGLGLTLRDGVLVAIGWAIVVPEIALILWLWP
ncbi:exopolysaccharide synthesis, exoD [Actibacterium atlanticum]|uniref:Exopolysaccharide synthesis, exoD n=1 Tax=Actibacterium atlanticum TaxID=1461693 RepID=A0A058ZPP7_9RHOB|nr:exopolysaccharide biosynthesis protein [Actibacterium atlanticum]KCV83190.1 exopolysaccharide synthesis, exoD [Actibacterium atlanticum]